MINAQELRIGNWVCDQINGEYQIQAVARNGVWINDPSLGGSPVGSETINPIPLTEKWLLKFGLTKRGGWYGWSYSKNGAEFGWVGHLFLSFGEDNKKDVKINTVHQLQNLFFALTGTELEIK